MRYVDCLWSSGGVLLGGDHPLQPTFDILCDSGGGGASVTSCHRPVLDDEALSETYYCFGSSQIWEATSIVTISCLARGMNFAGDSCVTITFLAYVHEFRGQLKRYDNFLVHGHEFGGCSVEKWHPWPWWLITRRGVRSAPLLLARLPLSFPRASLARIVWSTLLAYVIKSQTFLAESSPLIRTGKCRVSLRTTSVRKSFFFLGLIPGIAQ